jgi:hypothetical protein
VQERRPEVHRDGRAARGRKPDQHGMRERHRTGR